MVRWMNGFMVTCSSSSNGKWTCTLQAANVSHRSSSVFDGVDDGSIDNDDDDDDDDYSPCLASTQLLQ